MAHELFYLVQRWQGTPFRQGTLSTDPTVSILVHFHEEFEICRFPAFRLQGYDHKAITALQTKFEMDQFQVLTMPACTTRPATKPALLKPRDKASPTWNDNAELCTQISAACRATNGTKQRHAQEWTVKTVLTPQESFTYLKLGDERRHWSPTLALPL